MMWRSRLLAMAYKAGRDRDSSHGPRADDRGTLTALLRLASI